MTYPHGASTTDAYATRTELPQVDDAELEQMIAEWLERHPGAQRSQAMDAALHGLANPSHVEAQQHKRDAMATKALTESLASMDFDNVDVEWIDQQIEQFSKFVIAGDEGDDGEIRKQAA
jgi:hypothetical protein